MTHIVHYVQTRCTVSEQHLDEVLGKSPRLPIKLGAKLWHLFLSKNTLLRARPCKCKLSPTATTVTQPQTSVRNCSVFAGLVDLQLESVAAQFS